MPSAAERSAWPRKSTAGKIAALARATGLDWPAIEKLGDEELAARLYRPPVPRLARQLEPDYARIHQELKSPGVTLQLLWEEYARGNALAYKYTSFCVKYRQWRQALALSMRQTHVAGERLFIDYAGPTVAIIEAASGAESRRRRSSWPCSGRRTVSRNSKLPTCRN